MVGMDVPGKLWRTTAPHQSAIGVNASLMRSSRPRSCAKEMDEKNSAMVVIINHFIKES